MKNGDVNEKENETVSENANDEPESEFSLERNKFSWDILSLYC